MDGYKLGVVETRFAELIWQHEPLTSGELVKLCEQELQWKKSTTYTVLKKLCEHGIFQNENGTVTSLLSQEGYNAVQSEKFVAVSYTHLDVYKRQLYISPHLSVPLNR